jgi:biotin carboxyl carrier protein
VKAGDKVKAGDNLIIEESMKMEINIVSTCNGVIDKVYVESGDEVQPGQVLVSIEEEK